MSDYSASDRPARREPLVELHSTCEQSLFLRQLPWWPVEALADQLFALSREGDPRLALADSHGCTLLHHMAARWPCDDPLARSMIQALIEAGIDLNAPTLHGQLSALHCASSRGHGLFVSALLACGADPNRVDRQGRHALFEAALANSMECFELLLRHGADPDLVDRSGRRPCDFDPIEEGFVDPSHWERLLRAASERRALEAESAEAGRGGSRGRL